MLDAPEPKAQRFVNRHLRLQRFIATESHERYKSFFVMRKTHMDPTQGEPYREISFSSKDERLARSDEYHVQYSPDFEGCGELNKGPQAPQPHHAEDLRALARWRTSLQALHEALSGTSSRVPKEGGHRALLKR